jgi:hypothetical protein
MAGASASTGRVVGWRLHVPAAPHVCAAQLSRGEAEELCRSSPEAQQAGVNARTLAKLHEVCLASEVRSILRVCPAFAAIDLVTWTEFLESYGFSRPQIKHMITSSPQEFVRATVVTAGQTMLTCKRLGLAPDAQIQLLTYYPQLLHMDEEQVKSMVRIVAQYQGPIDTLS